jgi:2-phospho-L-lactate guanylyltransferase
VISELWAVVPIKALDQAKSRLAPVMGPADRRALVLEMLRHTLSVLRISDGLRGIVVISPDPEVGEVAVVQGADFLPESGGGGLNGALAQASASLPAGRGQGMLVIPGDLPHLRLSSIRELVSLAVPCGVVIAPDRRERGTNALLVAPPDLIPFCFGPDSFRLHLAAAAAAGVTPIVVRSPDLAMDVDVPEDLSLVPEYERLCFPPD